MASIDLANLLGIPNLSVYLDQVDQALSKAIITGNPYITDPLVRLFKSKGKRLRPSFLIAVAYSQGKKIDKNVISACVAVELVHIGTLVHDDIIDESDMRWNRPTINSLEGNSNALIIGDFLLARACLEAAGISAQVGEKIAAVIIELCNGQGRELADQFNVNRTQKAYMASIKGKTAALLSVACEVGAICAGADRSKVKTFAKYGEEFGMSFQLLDDLIDLVSSPELVGKETGTDIKEGVYTMPVLLSLGGPNNKKVAKLIKDGSTGSIAQLLDILFNDGSLSHTLKLARQHTKQSIASLDGIVGKSSIADLATFPRNYLDWSLNNLVADKYKSILS